NNQKLNVRYKYVKSIEEKLNKEYDSVKNALNLIEKKNERFDYLINKIEPETLSENIITELPYNREKYITTLLDKLESLGYKVENREYKVSREKTSFEEYCNKFIKDTRIKNIEISVKHYKNKKKVLKIIVINKLKIKELKIWLFQV